MRRVNWLLGDGTLSARELRVTVTRVRNITDGVGGHHDRWDIDATHDDGCGRLVQSRFNYRQTAWDGVRTHLESIENERYLRLPYAHNVNMDVAPGRLHVQTDPLHDASVRIAHGLLHAVRAAADWPVDRGSPLPRDAAPGVAVQLLLRNVRLAVAPAETLCHLDAGAILTEYINDQPSTASALLKVLARPGVVWHSAAGEAARWRFALMLREGRPAGREWADCVTELTAAGMPLGKYRHEGVELVRVGKLPVLNSVRVTGTRSLLVEACMAANIAASRALIAAGADLLERVESEYEDSARRPTCGLWAALDTGEEDLVRAVVEAAPASQHAQLSQYYDAWRGLSSYAPDRSICERLFTALRARAAMAGALAPEPARPGGG